MAETQEGTLWNNSIPMLPEDLVEKTRRPQVSSGSKLSDNPLSSSVSSQSWSFQQLQSIIIKLFLTEPCYQGSKMPTDCWNTPEHVLLSSQSQWSLTIHQHCSVGYTRCTGRSSVFRPRLWQRDSFSVLCGPSPIFICSFLSCCSTACCSEGWLSDHLFSHMVTHSATAIHHFSKLGNISPL